VETSVGRIVLRTGLVASFGSLIAQLLFMLPDWRRWPCILMRDSRMAAAVPLGARALTRAVSPVRALMWATAVHLLVAVSDALVVYRLAEMPALGKRFLRFPLGFGVAYGLAAYAFRFYALQSLGFPWFRQLRTPSYLFTHIAHGALTALTLKRSADEARTGGNA
jgi:hypothetical protein